MTSNLTAYLQGTVRLFAARDAGHEEDDILNELDVIWFQLSDDDHVVIDYAVAKVASNEWSHADFAAFVASRS